MVERAMEKGLEGARIPTKHNEVSPFFHIDRKKGTIKTDGLSPVVIMKKIKLRRSDGQTPVTLREVLPELEDADEPQDLESQNIRDQNAQQRDSKADQGDVSFVHTMTLEELNDHVQKCLEMSTENKINQKNAFALQLIDCMSMLVKSQKDFSKMACTLDAGAKIYSYRVDSLHQQVLKLAEEVLQNIRKSEVMPGDKALNKVKEVNEKRRGRKKTMIASRESLRRKLKGTDPKDKYIKLEALPGAIISGARRDPKDLSFSLDLDVPFWQTKDKYKPVKAEGTVTLPEVKIVRDEILAESLPCSPELIPTQTKAATTYDDKCNVLMGIDENSSEDYVSIVDFSSSDSEAKNNNIEETENHEREGSNVGVNEANVVLTAMERLKTEAETCGAVNKVPSRLEAMKMLFEDVGEYDYLNVKNKNYWAGPDFWKRPRHQGVNVVEKKQIRRKKREPGEIDFDADNVDEEWRKLFKKGYSLGEKTVKHWKKTNNTLPKDLKTDAKIFLDLFHMTIYRQKDEKKGTDSVECINLFEGSNVNEISRDINSQEVVNSSDSQDPLNDSFYQGIPGNQNSGSSSDRDPLNSAFYDVGILQPRTSQSNVAGFSSGKILRVEVASEKKQMFGETSMVPIPKMVKFQPLKYSTKPIRVDMQHLKRSMMGVIEEQIEHDEQKNRGMESVASSSKANLSVSAETRFSDILKNLPERLEKRTAEDTSPAIAFMTLLTLANEHNLQLENTENYDDVVVKFESQEDEGRDKNCVEPTFMDVDL